jgi:Tannase-like family of unknown function (DUF6351)/Cytochrome C'
VRHRTIRGIISASFATAGFVACVQVVQAESGSTRSNHAIQISTLSSRPQLVSGGNVLTSILLPQSLDQSQVRVTLNGQDIASEFIADEAAHILVGLVTGLRLGENSLTAWSANSRDGNTRTRVTLTNHPITGPIISGPHQQPFICTAAQYKIYSGLYGIDLIDDTTLGPPTDAQCSVPTKITYLYLPKGGTAFKPLPNAKLLPDDVSQVTTLAGATVNFVVRVETASIDRGIYQSAVLHDPTLDDELSWRTPPRGWNRRLIVVEGAGCPGGWYHQGTAGAGMSLAGVVEFSLFSPAKSKPSLIEIAHYASSLQEVAASQQQWFPAGSGVESGIKTGAKAEIWSQPAEFAKWERDLSAAIVQLVKVVAGQDIENVRHQHEQLGRVCAGCHKTFRAKDD